MIKMGGDQWPEQVPILTLAQLLDGSIVNLMARVEGQVVYLYYSPAGGGHAPIPHIARAHLSNVAPLQSIHLTQSRRS